MAPDSSTLAWKIPWTEESGRLQSMGFRRVGHDWATSLSLFTFMHWRRKWQPTGVFAWRIPGMEESGGLPSMGSHRVGRDWSDLAAAAAFPLTLHGSLWNISDLGPNCCQGKKEQPPDTAEQCSLCSSDKAAQGPPAFPKDLTTTVLPSFSVKRLSKLSTSVIHKILNLPESAWILSFCF